MPETNIVVLHDHTPQRISLPDHPPFLLRFSRRHRSSHDVCITTKPTSLLLLLLLLRFVLFFVKEEKMPFWRGKKTLKKKNSACTTRIRLKSALYLHGMHETAKKRKTIPHHARNGKKVAWKEARSRIRTKVAGFKVQNDNQLHQSSTQHALSPNLKYIFLQNSPKQQQFSFQKRTFFLRLLLLLTFVFLFVVGLFQIITNNNQ